MDTNKLKKFATEARNRLKAGIAAKIITLGFDKNGRVPDHMHPQLMQGGSLWNGRLETEGFYHQWQALYSRVQQKGIKEVYEEAAYTWFNRLVAIRILQKNSLIEPVLDYVDQARTPRIVDEARMGRMPQMQERQRQLLMELLDDDAKTTEQFAILVTAFCHENPILSRCFGAMSDYTELLLPNDILTEGGFIDMLNHTEFITDDDFRSPELIGWLYQFYISERKDEVFAKKGKFEADEIPAATQIFTPNWIVKYMVQNTIGRIYLDNNPSAASEFKPKWQYLVEPSEPTPKEAIYKYKELTDLLVGDLACGSGHILNECFDLLYDLYIYEGYSRREAVEYIFTNNLRGIDLDTRAKQLATFALMLKACQKDSAFADAHILPKVLSMPTPIPQEQVSERLKEFFRETPSNQIHKELTAAFELMQDADSLGSIMKFDLAESTRLAIRQTMDYWHCQGFVPETVEDIMPAIDFMLTLTDKYSALVMNPPYMGNGNMNEVLSNYVKRNYEDGKADLMTVFMILSQEKTVDKGKYGMINLPSWLFLSTFDILRKNILNTFHIDSLIHMGRGIFGIDWGSTAFIFSKCNMDNDGVFFRLHKRNFQHIYYYHIEQLFLNALRDHTFKYNFDEYRDKEGVFFKAESKEGGLQLYYSINQTNFIKIPGSPIAYWAVPKIIEAFQKETLRNITQTSEGIKTGNNDKYLRLWTEVNASEISVTIPSYENRKWDLLHKGGDKRKWYGNIDNVVLWEKDGYEIRNSPNSGIQGVAMYSKDCFTWSDISSKGLSFRIKPQNQKIDSKGPSGFCNDSKLLYYTIGLLNSRITEYCSTFLNPTISFKVGNVRNIPFIYDDDRNPSISNRVKDSISISKKDWDSHETSWDFESNPLVALRNEKVAQGNLDSSFRLSDFVDEFETQWTERFMQLHQNEEELNRQFISIYGLEDELTPDVPLDEITILQQGEISIEKETK